MSAPWCERHPPWRSPDELRAVDRGEPGDPARAGKFVGERPGDRPDDARGLEPTAVLEPPLRATEPCRLIVLQLLELRRGRVRSRRSRTPAPASPSASISITPAASSAPRMTTALPRCSSCCPRWNPRTVLRLTPASSASSSCVQSSSARAARVLTRVNAMSRNMEL